MLTRSQWRRQENAVLAAEAETPLERRLSQVIMRGGHGPKPSKVKAGAAIMTEGGAAEEIVLVLDGMVEVEAGGTELARMAPGPSSASARSSSRAGAPPRSVR